MPLQAIGIWLTFTMLAVAQSSYSRMIALPDGKTVYFSFATTPFQTDSYVARAADDGSIRVETAGADLAGASDSGDVLLRASFGYRVLHLDCVGHACPSPPPPGCRTRLTVEGPGGVLYSQTDHPSQGQVNRFGDIFLDLPHGPFHICGLRRRHGSRIDAGPSCHGLSQYSDLGVPRR